MAGDDKKDRYEWVSTGGCTRCDSMEGRYYLSPTGVPRPHPNCNCTVLNRTRTKEECDSSDAVFLVSYSGNSHHGPSEDVDDHFDMFYDYTITCWGDAAVVTGQVVVEATYGDLHGPNYPDSLESDRSIEDFYEDRFAEALELVEQVAVEECPVCGTHPSVA